LDAKIDLLHRQNKTLEAMAETLFRQWFVVRNAADEAEEGWEEFVLTDVATHCKDSVNPGEHPARTYHHYSLPAYDEGRKPSPELGETIKSSKYVVPEKAVLVSKLNPRFPRVWPILHRKHEHAISSTEFQVFVPKDVEIFSFLYCYLSSKGVQDELASAASGTSGSHQRVSPNDIKGLTFQAKSKQQLVDFSKVVNPMLEKIEVNKNQVANLTALRDTLLPKLMSGEVRVQLP
jgi:type I restriction enzyme S subunit